MNVPMRVPYRYEGHCPLCGTRLLVFAPDPITEDMRYCSQCRESLEAGHLDPASAGPAFLDEGALAS